MYKRQGYYNKETDNNDEDHIIPETTITWNPGNGTATGGLASIDRDVDINGSIAGSLSRITYPLGGYTQFSYESNEYFLPDTIQNNTYIGGLLSGCNATSESSNSHLHTITYDEKLFGEVVINLNNPQQCSGSYGYVDIYDGSTLITSVSVDLSNTTNTLNIQSSALVNGTEYTFEIFSYRCAITVNLDVNSVGTDELCGGLRLKSISTYDNNTSTQIRREFNYTMDDINGASSGVLYRTPKYGMRVATPDLYLDSVFNTNSILPIQSADGYHVGYTTAEVDYIGNGTKRIYYYNDLPANEEDISYPPTPEPEREFVGQYRSEQILREDGEELSSRSVVMEGGYNSTTGSKMVHVRKLEETAAVEYYVHSGRYLADSVVTISEGIKTITDYAYDNYAVYQPRAILVHDAFGNELSSTYVEYTDIYSDTNGEDTYLDDNNIITPYFIETIVNYVFNNRTQTTTSYDMFSGVARPSEQTVVKRLYDGVSTSFISETTDYKSYDSKGNLDKIRLPGELLDREYFYYTSDNNLLEKSCFGNLCTEFTYSNGNSTRLLTQKENVDGTTMSYTYDGLKRLKQTKDNQTLAQTDITYHLSKTDKSYTKSVETYQADPLGLSMLTNRETRSYVDGLGRPIQTVGVNQAYSSGDQVTSQTYDNQGRVQYQYETRRESGNNGDYVAPQLSWDKSETVYESSPLNRVSSVTPPSWHPTSSTYGVNTATDLVIDHDNGGNHAAGTLHKRTTIDGNGNLSITFTDVRGLQILSRRADATDTQRNDTYYLYDDKNQLVQVIPPGSTKDDAALNFFYRYDPEGKTIAKKVPSKGWIDYVYNDRDLLIAQRDSFLRAKPVSPAGGWYVYKYDIYNRETDSGFSESATAPTGDIAGSIPSLQNSIAYSNVSDPSMGKVTWTYSKILGTTDFLKSFSTYDHAGRIANIRSDNHLAINYPIPDSTTYYYDGADNVVKTRYRINDVNQSPTIIEESHELDGNGRMTKQFLNLNGVSQQLCQSAYDGEDQLINKVVGGGLTDYLLLTQYDYLDNGLLKSVDGETSNSTYFYGYQMNYDTLPSITNSSSGTPQTYMNGNIASIQWATIGEPTALSLYEYDYLDRLTHSYTNDNHYNTEYGYDARGNFDYIKRHSEVDGIPTMIDDLDPDYVSGNANQMLRMNEAASADKGYKSNNAGDYSYDGNGNMITDPEKGISMTYNHLDLVDTVTWDDGRQLIFTYDANGSLLTQQNIDDTEVKKQDYLGVIEYLEGYPYVVHHAEGRVVNQGVSAYLKYLYLDHNQEIDGLFEAQRVESIGNIMDSTTLYEASQEIILDDGFEVSANAGFIAQIVTAPVYQEDWQYEWTITDHLGNLRMVYSDLNGNGTIDGKAEMLQEVEYYPYGMRRNNYERTALKNNYQYNGIEHVGDFGLDLNMATYRSLDAALGQWGQVDPKAEATYSLTPYGSMNNNPISNIDPDGDLPILVPIIAGAIGGGLNVWKNWDHIQQGGLWAGVKAFGIGAGAGVAVFMLLPLQQ